jgi:hypothetical protein
MPSQEMLPLTFMGVEMLLFDNSVLKNYLLNNTQLYFHITSFNYFIFLFASYNNLSEVYDKKINIWPFQYHPGYHPSISCWYRVHIMIHGLIWKSHLLISLLKISISSDMQCNNFFHLIIIVLNHISIRKFKFSTWRTVTLQGKYFEFNLYINSWNALGTSYYKWSPPYTLITIHNLYDMNKFLYIYQSPYYLSVFKIHLWCKSIVKTLHYV